MMNTGKCLAVLLLALVEITTGRFTMVFTDHDYNSSCQQATSSFTITLGNTKYSAPCKPTKMRFDCGDDTFDVTYEDMIKKKDIYIEECDKPNVRVFSHTAQKTVSCHCKTRKFVFPVHYGDTYGVTIDNEDEIMASELFSHMKNLNIL